MVFKQLFAKSAVLLTSVGDNRHLCRKTNVLSSHRCLFDTGTEKMNNIEIQNRLEVWPPGVYK